MTLHKHKTALALLLSALALLLPLATLTAQSTGTATVTIHLVDHSTGAPIPGEVGLVLHTERSVLLKHATANAQGEAVFTELPAGTAHLSTKQADYAVQHVNLSLTDGATQRLALQLQRALVVRGFVLDANGAPLVGAAVKAVYETSPASLNNSYQWETGDARSDEQGAFELSVHPTRAFVIEATHTGWLSTVSTPLQAQTLQPLLLRLRKGVSVTGVALDAAGNPLPQARVQLQEAVEATENVRFLSFEALQQSQQTTVTGADGTFHFANVSPTQKRLTVWHTQFKPEQQMLDLTAAPAQVETRLMLRYRHER